MSKTKINKNPSLSGDLYYGDTDGRAVVSKGLLSVSYILDSLTDGGNKMLDGRIASGLATALRGYAKFVRLKGEERRPVEFRPGIRYLP